MSPLVRTCLVILLSGVLTGCGGGGAVSSGPFGAPDHIPLLKPFAGEWAFDFEKTLAQRKAEGVPEEQLAPIRKYRLDNPNSGNLHADLSIEGNVAVSPGLALAPGVTLTAEYRMFALHQHGSKVCGKAWHHEDRNDPGDMSKCYVRLQIKDELLYLEVKSQDGNPDLNDPDLGLSSLPPESPLEKCDAESPAGIDWSEEWELYVFKRKT